MKHEWKESNDPLYTPGKIRTASGTFVNPVEMKPEEVFLGDIAHGLANRCRFGGFTHKWWSVADHSMHCADLAMEHFNNRELALCCLMHDAHEAYLGDMPSPLARAIDERFPSFLYMWESAKRYCQNSINKRFLLEHSFGKWPGQIHQIDKAALEMEWEKKVLRWTGFPPIPPEESANLFIQRFTEYYNQPFIIWP